MGRMHPQLATVFDTQSVDLGDSDGSSPFIPHMELVADAMMQGSFSSQMGGSGGGAMPSQSVPQLMLGALSETAAGVPGRLHPASAAGRAMPMQQSMRQRSISGKRPPSATGMVGAGVPSVAAGVAAAGSSSRSPTRPEAGRSRSFSGRAGSFSGQAASFSGRAGAGGVGNDFDLGSSLLPEHSAPVLTPRTRYRQIRERVDRVSTQLQQSAEAEAAEQARIARRKQREQPAEHASTASAGGDAGVEGGGGGAGGDSSPTAEQAGLGGWAGKWRTPLQDLQEEYTGEAERKAKRECVCVCVCCRVVFHLLTMCMRPTIPQRLHALHEELKHRCANAKAIFFAGPGIFFTAAILC